MLKFRTYKFDERNSEENINKFLKEEREKLHPSGIHVFEGRICFVYDDASDEEADQIVALTNLRKQLSGARIERLIRQQELFFAERDSSTGKGKVGALMDAKHEMEKSEERIAYLEKQIVVLREQNK